MGFVVRLKRNQLVGGTNNDEIYPITATNAVYREGGKNLEEILSELGSSSNRKVVEDITYTKPNLNITYTTNESTSIPIGVDVDNKEAQLAFGQTSTIATIGDTDVTITMPEAPSVTIDLPEISAIDVNVTKWGTLQDYKYWFDSSISEPNNRDSLLYAIGMSLKINPTTRMRDFGDGGTGCFTRIHILNDITISNNIWLNTEKTEWYGYGRKITFSDTSNTTPYNLKVFGTSFKVNNVMFQYTNGEGSIESDIQFSPSTYIRIALNDGEHKTTAVFNTCFFTNFLKYKYVTSSSSHNITSNVIIKVECYNYNNIEGLNAIKADSNLTKQDSDSNTIAIEFNKCKANIRKYLINSSSLQSGLQMASYNNAMFVIQQQQNVGAVSVQSYFGQGVVNRVESQYKQYYSSQKILYDANSKSVAQDITLYGNGGHALEYSESGYSTNTTASRRINSALKLMVWYGPTLTEQQELINSL